VKFLDADMGVVTAGSRQNVDIGHAILARPQIVDVELRRKPQFPVHRLEVRAAVKQTHANPEMLLHSQGFAGTEERVSAGLIGTRISGGRQAAELRQRIAGSFDIQEEPASENGEI